MFLRRKPNLSSTDEELALALTSGRQSALGMLWDRYAHLLYGVCMKYLRDPERSKDMVADLFASLPELLRKHRVDRFRPWVHTVMRNRCLLDLRRQRPSARMDQMREPIADEAGEAALREASLQQLEAAIAELNDLQRACIRLFHLERCTYQQTAERAGLSVEQVRSNLQNGRRNLRIILTRHAHQST
jgi:RNA polymerase sigma factor (sigma-70 family)